MLPPELSHEVSELYESDYWEVCPVCGTHHNAPVCPRCGSGATVTRYAHGISMEPMEAMGGLLEWGITPAGAPVAHVKRSRQRDASKAGNRKNTRIRSFSQRSRRSLLAHLGKVRADQMGAGFFATLTYHERHHWPADPQIKQHLRAWFERIRRIDHTFGACWRLEPQARGAPHFHVLLWSDVVTAAQLRQAWIEVVGATEDGPFRTYGAQIEPIRTWRKLMRYVAKYVGKESADAGYEWGRRWGFVGWVPMDAIDELELSPADVVQVKRICRRLLKARGFRKGAQQVAYFASWVGVDDVGDLWEWIDRLRAARGPPEAPPGLRDRLAAYRQARESGAIQVHTVAPHVRRFRYMGRGTSDA